MMERTMPDLVTCVRCGRWTEWEATADGKNVICPNCLTRPEEEAGGDAA